MADLSKNIIRLINKIVLLPLTIREKILLKEKNFIIISNNCWGYSIYNTLKRPYNTPFVGLFIPPESYISLLKNFPNCLNDSLKFIETDQTYPIAYLGDTKIKIHFMHYLTNIEAQEKWSRRVDRLFDALKENEDLFFKFCDSEGCTSTHLDSFHALPFKYKISFTVEEYDHDNNMYVPYLRDENTQSIVNGLQLYKNRYRCLDFVQWLLHGKIVKRT